MNDKRVLERLLGVQAQLDAARNELVDIVTDVGVNLAVRTIEPAPDAGVVQQRQHVAAPVLVQRQLSSSMARLNMQIHGVRGQPAAGDVVYVLKEFFTTEFGSWELGQSEFGMETWAREKYLKPANAPDYFDDAGGDHHLFGAVVGADGELLKNFPFVFRHPGGLNRPGTKERSGWVCVPIYAKYAPDQGERGAWSWYPAGEFVEELEGGSLPWGRHVSMFAVWEEVRYGG